MRAYLIDYDTAERIKTELSADTIVEFQDVVGFDQAVPAEEILEKADPAIGSLVGEIARRVLELNGGPPSALFLAGGGSKLSGLCARVAEALEMDTKRVALAGRPFQNDLLCGRNPARRSGICNSFGDCGFFLSGADQRQQPRFSQ